MNCQQCGTELTPDQAFCARCGLAVAPTGGAPSPAPANLQTQAMSPVAAAAMAPAAAKPDNQPARTVAMPLPPQAVGAAAPGPQITEPAAPTPQGHAAPATGSEATALAVPPPQGQPGPATGVEATALAVPPHQDPALPASGNEATALAVPPPQGQAQLPHRGKGAMTMMAGAGLNMAETFNTAFGQRFAGWRTELAPPAGPSTGGGKQAIQPISIIGATGNRLAIGRVDPVQRTVTLRTFNFVTAMHVQRYGGHVAINPTDYQSFLANVGTMFSATGFRIDYEDAAAAGAHVAQPASGSGKMVWILLTLLVLTGLGLLVYWQLWAK